MKLSLGVLAALAGVNEANIACPVTGKTIFEASCDKDGFKIKINEACRAAGFAGIDFPNAFVWGVNTVTTMATPGCTAPCLATDVVTGSGATCSSAKPVTATTTVDSDNAQTYQWTVPFNECAVAAPVWDSTGNYYKYELFLNSNSVADTANALAQMEQVKFTCKLEAFQEDAGAVTINQGDLVADAEVKLDLTPLVELQVSTAPSTTLDTKTSAATYDGTTAMLAMTTAGATTANLGDHVELRLKETTGNTPFTTYALSLYKCWASKAALPSTDGTDTMTSTSTDVAMEFEFWDQFCPKYNWVAPESGATTGKGYLQTHWDRATSLHAINFRQFAFLDSGFTIGTDTITYHCFVKVCPIADAATCSTKDLTDTANTCTAPTYYDPAGRRRREADRERTRRSEADGSTMVEVTKTVETPKVAPEDCHTIVNGACIVQKDEQPRSSGSTQAVAATGLAAFLAAINL